jgi:hypothetical protein
VPSTSSLTDILSYVLQGSLVSLPQSHTLIFRFGRIKGGFQSRQLNIVQFNTLGLDIPYAWPKSGPKIVLT